MRFETGVLGMFVFILYGGFWGLAFAGFPYAIALKTGNPAAVNASFILFFPFAFLTTTFLPKEALTGWLATVADVQPGDLRARRIAQSHHGGLGRERPRSGAWPRRRR